MVRYHIVCIHLIDKLRIDGVGVVIAGQPTGTYKEFLPIEHLNDLPSKGHTCYFVNKGIAFLYQNLHWYLRHYKEVNNPVSSFHFLIFDTNCKLHLL